MLIIDNNKRYRRIMSESERNKILCDKFIPASSSDNWKPIYNPDTVVFLFDLHFADKVRLKQVRQLHYENYGETWTLEFDADIPTEGDASQSGWPGAVVHRGPIDLALLKNLVWRKFNP